MIDSPRGRKSDLVDCLLDREGDCAGPAEAKVDSSVVQQQRGDLVVRKGDLAGPAGAIDFLLDRKGNPRDFLGDRKGVFVGPAEAKVDGHDVRQQCGYLVVREGNVVGPPGRPTSSWTGRPTSSTSFSGARRHLGQEGRLRWRHRGEDGDERDGRARHRSSVTERATQRAPRRTPQPSRGASSRRSRSSGSSRRSRTRARPRRSANSSRAPPRLEAKAAGKPPELAALGRAAQETRGRGGPDSAASVTQPRRLRRQFSTAGGRGPARGSAPRRRPARSSEDRAQQSGRQAERPDLPRGTRPRTSSDGHVEPLADQHRAQGAERQRARADRPLAGQWATPRGQRHQARRSGARLDRLRGVAELLEQGELFREDRSAQKETAKAAAAK